MKALGMIEVLGYLPAVEALDSALKSADVSLVDVIKVKGGQVTVLVDGDVGAVKAAMDASAAAAEKVGLVISVHVIPRPADNVAKMFGQGKPAAEPKQLKEPKEPEAEQVEEEPGTDLDELGTAAATDDTDTISGLTVAQLRTMARDMGNTGMTKEEIRFAKKQELIQAITNTEQES